MKWWNSNCHHMLHKNLLEIFLICWNEMYFSDYSFTLKSYILRQDRIRIKQRCLSRLDLYKALGFRWSNSKKLGDSYWIGLFEKQSHMVKWYEKWFKHMKNSESSKSWFCLTRKKKQQQKQTKRSSVAIIGCDFMLFIYNYYFFQHTSHHFLLSLKSLFLGRKIVYLSFRQKNAKGKSSAIGFCSKI